MTKKGYKQTEEHRRKVALTKTGSRNHNWRGDEALPASGRERARRLYKEIGPCERCGNPDAERHHKDGDTTNNIADNIKILCRRCHMLEDGRLEVLRKDIVNRRPAVKIKESDIPTIFALREAGMLQKEIADKFHVVPSRISETLSGKYHK